MPWLVLLLSLAARAESTLPELSPDALVASSLQALSLIDQGHEGELWDKGPEMIRSMQSRESFASGIGALRKNFGVAQKRLWQQLNLFSIRESGPALPPVGFYVNVSFSTLTTDEAPVTESVSLAYQDGKWLPVGYFVGRPAPPAKRTDGNSAQPASSP